MHPKLCGTASTMRQMAAGSAPLVRFGNSFSSARCDLRDHGRHRTFVGTVALEARADVVDDDPYAFTPCGCGGVRPLLFRAPGTTMLWNMLPGLISSFRTHAGDQSTGFVNS